MQKRFLLTTDASCAAGLVVSIESVVRAVNRALRVALVGLVLVPPSVVCGQSDSASHRRLELPDGGSSDLQRQMLLLQQLQSLVSNGQSQQSPPTTPPNAASGPAVTPDQLQALQQLMKSFGGRIPPGMLPDPKDIPPELISGIMSDPNARQQIQDMLKQYAQDRQLPQGSDGRGPDILPPRTDGENSGRRNDINAAPQNGSPGRNTESASENPARGSEPSDARTDDSSEQQLPSMNELMNKLKDLQQKYLPEDGADGPGSDTSDSGYRQQDTTPNSSASPLQNSPASTPGQSPRRRPASPQTSPQTDDDWARLLEQLAERQRQSGRPSDQQPAAGSRNGIGGQDRPGAGTPDQSRDSDISSVQDFLKKFQDVPLQPSAPLADASSTQPGASAGLSRQSRNGSPEPSPKIEPSLDTGPSPEELRRTQQQIKSELDRNGFQQALRRIAREAQQQAQSAANSGSSGLPAAGNAPAVRDAGVEAALFRALDGVREDLLEIAKEAKFKPGNSDTSMGNRANGSGSAAVRSAGSDNDRPSAMREFRSSAKDFLSGLIQGPAAAPSRPATPSALPGSSMPGTGNSSFGYVLLLTLAAIAAILFWKLSRPGLLAHEHAAGGTRMKAMHIRTKADVIRAFHQMALTPGRDTEPWWTHHQVVDDLIQRSPKTFDEARLLAQLYEQARYLPADTEFTAEQIQQARDALQWCRQ
ncbi:MAG: DUF4129 domain-containing protein [Fuerstiella sp.]